MSTIRYYAVARDPQGRIGQMLVTRLMAAPGVPAAPPRQVWTGVTYKTEREAAKDLARLNTVAFCRGE